MESPKEVAVRKKALCILLGLCVLSIGASARGMTSTAMAKLDPRLTRLYTDPGISARPLGETITILGTSLDDAVVPVLIKTIASRSELEAAGAIVGSRHGDIVTARVPLEKLEELALLPSVESVEASYRLYAVLDVSTVECGGAAVHAGSPPYTGNGIIVGLLDSGIDPINDDFEDAPNDSRVLYIWDQFGAGPAPSGYSYGTEWTKAQIDAGSCTMTDPNAHGSHCAGIAAGDGSSSASGYIGMAPDANIIMVANRSDDMFNYGGREGYVATTAYSLDGLNYMSGKATSESMPLVVSWSQSVCMGPHDGSTLFEQGVDNFISSTNVPVVVAAGNNQEADLHASGTVTTGSPVTVTFNVGSSYTSVPFEVWYAFGDLMTLELLPPGEATWYGPYGPDTGGWTAPTNAHGDQMWIWGNDDHSTSHKGYFQVSLENGTLGVVQGSWQVRLTADNALPQGGDFDIWFERSRPSVTCQDHIDLTVVVGMPATAHDVITVGSYCTKDPWQDIDGSWWTYGATVGVISSFSSNGPTADGRQKPDLSAPGQIVASVMSSGAAPTYLASRRQLVAPDGLHLYMAGTRMATPHVAGTVALMLEHTPTLTPLQAKMMLISGARDAGPVGWDPAYGWGKLDAAAAIEVEWPGSMTLSIIESGGDLQLSWSPCTGSSAYWIFGADNHCYFDPGFSPGYEHRLDILPPATLTWSTTDAIGDPAHNWTYLVLAVDSSEQELTRSNRAGEFEFALP